MPVKKFKFSVIYCAQMSFARRQDGVSRVSLISNKLGGKNKMNGRRRRIEERKKTTKTKGEEEGEERER